MVYQFAQALSETGRTVGNIIFFLIGIVFVVAILAFPLWMLIDAAIKPVNNKVLWIVLIIIFGPVPALIYFLTDRKKFLERGTSPHTQTWAATPPQQPDSGTAAWPTTSPTANTEAPNPTDTPGTPEEAEKPGDKSADNK
jgi:hypothetical protein